VMFGAVLTVTWRCLDHFPAVFHNFFAMTRVPTSLATVICIFYIDMSHITQEIAQLKRRESYSLDLSKIGFFAQ